MGAKSLIIGYIEEPYVPEPQRDALIKDHNRARLFIFPKIGEWPRLTRGFFSVSGPEGESDCGIRSELPETVQDLGFSWWVAKLL